MKFEVLTNENFDRFCIRLSELLDERRGTTPIRFTSPRGVVEEYIGFEVLRIRPSSDGLLKVKIRLFNRRGKETERVFAAYPGRTALLIGNTGFCRVEFSFNAGSYHHGLCEVHELPHYPANAKPLKMCFAVSRQAKVS